MVLTCISLITNDVVISHLFNFISEISVHIFDHFYIVCLCVCLHLVAQSHPTLFAAPLMWAIAYQAPLSMEFSRQECWSRLPCHPPGDLPDPGTEPESVSLLLWQEGSLPLVPAKGVWLMKW